MSKDSEVCLPLSRMIVLSEEEVFSHDHSARKLVWHIAKGAGRILGSLGPEEAGEIEWSSLAWCIAEDLFCGLHCAQWS